MKVRIVCEEQFISLNRLMNLVVKVLLKNAAFVSLFLFVGTHFRIFVRKFLVHLRTMYASPQKLARRLWMNLPTRKLPWTYSDSSRVICLKLSRATNGSYGHNQDACANKPPTTTTTCFSWNRLGSRSHHNYGNFINGWENDFKCETGVILEIQNNNGLF